MATKSAKSLWGRYLGLDRNNRVWARNGFVGSSLRIGATEGSEAAVEVEGLTTLENSATATAALSVRGITNLSSGASSLYTLAAPTAQGIRKRLVTVSSSTNVRQITSAVGIIRGASVGGDAGASSGSSAYTVMTFNGQGQVIELESISTAAWLALSAAGFSTAATQPFTTV